MTDQKFFHVETQRPDGTWQRFTAEASEGEEEAQASLKRVQDAIASGQIGPKDGSATIDMVRLREWTIEEQIAELTKEEREAAVCEYINSLPPGEFWKLVKAARERNQQDAKVL